MAKIIRNVGVLTLRHYKFPMAAISSILHRISGVILFLFVPFIIWVLDLSLSSQGSWYSVAECISEHGIIRFFVWVCLSALSFHFVAGIRHLLMDLSYFESLRGGAITSVIVMLISIVMIVVLGVWLW